MVMVNTIHNYAVESSGIHNVFAVPKQ